VNEIPGERHGAVHHSECKDCTLELSAILRDSDIGRTKPRTQDDTVKYFPRMICMEPPSPHRSVHGII
jgi:hypothetical protein